MLKSTRNAFYGSRQRSTYSGAQRIWEQAMSATTQVDERREMTHLVLDGTMSATVLSTKSEDGRTEREVVVTHDDKVSGASEVVYRQISVQDSRERSNSFVTESGSQTAAVDLLKRAATHHATSTKTLLRAIRRLQGADQVLEHIMPSGASAEYLLSQTVHT